MRSICVCYDCDAQKSVNIPQHAMHIEYMQTFYCSFAIIQYCSSQSKGQREAQRSAPRMTGRVRINPRVNPRAMTVPVEAAPCSRTSREKTLRVKPHGRVATCLTAVELSVRVRAVYELVNTRKDRILKLETLHHLQMVQVV